MTGKRRTLTDKFKAKVALDALRGLKSTAQLSTEHKVHPNQIRQWKKLLLSEASSLFSKGKSKVNNDEEVLSESLYEEIGRLKMELKWLEKKL